MTIDTSAILAILQDEPEREEFLARLGLAQRRHVSAISVLEVAIVLEGRRGEDAGSDLDLFLSRAAIEIVAFDQEHLHVARLRFVALAKAAPVQG